MDRCQRNGCGALLKTGEVRMRNSSMRNAFESWCSDGGRFPEHIDRESGGCGGYRLMSVQMTWNSWQAATKAALEGAANKFDGTTAYCFTAADEYANAFDIASELRHMADYLSNQDGS